MLIDDFVTRGATLIGAASRIENEGRRLELRVFALARSLTDAEAEKLCGLRAEVINLRANEVGRR